MSTDVCYSQAKPDVYIVSYTIVKIITQETILGTTPLSLQLQR
jgi:hypothetical protein